MGGSVEGVIGECHSGTVSEGTQAITGLELVLKRDLVNYKEGGRELGD